MDRKSVIVKALEIDSKLLSLSPEKFIKANDFQYTLAITTWLDVISRQSGEKAAIAVEFDVIRHGLVASINSACQAANVLIADQDKAELSTVWAWVCRDLSLRSALQVLRYLKRFTPIMCDRLDADCYTAYISQLNINKLRERREIPRWMVLWAKEVASDILGDIDFGPIMPNGVPEVFYTHGYFSSGVTWDAPKNCKAAKIDAWHSPFFGSPLYPTTNKESYRSLFWTWGSRAVAKAVPKSYKAKRIIAEEESERQFYMQGMREVIRDYISSHAWRPQLELDRQESQQRRCFDLRWATLDLSHASDSITCSIACDILPANVYQWLRLLRSNLVVVQDKCYLNTIFQTSGSAVCFDAESWIFLSVCQAACNWQSVFTGEEYLPVFVYGDDIEVDDRCYQTCVEWLEKFGFTVNCDKSFSSPSLYRESCGVEVYDGCEVSTSYWPRKEVSANKSCLQTLISLSDRLLSVGWDVAHMIVLDAIHTIAGNKFTTSSVLEPGYTTDARSFLDPITVAVSARRAYAPGTEVPDYEGHMVVRDIRVQPYPWDCADLDMYYYTMFLMHGPLYDDELSRLLGVSTSRRAKADTMYGIRTELAIAPRI